VNPKTKTEVLFSKVLLFAGAHKRSILRLFLALVTVGICYFLSGHDIGLPRKLSILNGAQGVTIGVTGIFLALLAPQSQRTCLVACWLCLWFTAGFAELRASAITDGIVVGGIIPYSDANNFLREASHLLEGRNLTAWGSRRPLSDSYIAGLLYLANGHVAPALILAGLLNAVAIGVCAIQIRKSLGVLGATLWTWLMLVYCRRFIGEVLSEQAGIAFSTLGTGFLVSAFATKSTPRLSIGLMLLSLALNARAGAFIVLPFLLVAALWRWRDTARLRTMILSTISIAAGFLISFCFLKTLGAPEGQLMSNYRYTLYGIVLGGDWQKAAADLPNLSSLSESARSAELDRRIIAAVKASPTLLWRAARRNWSDFFLRNKAALGPFSFFRSPDTENFLFVLSAIGLLWALPMFQCLAPLVLAASFGVVLSVPFLPTPDADRMRVYAATMPLMFLVPSFSFSGWRGWFNRLREAAPPTEVSVNIAPESARESPLPNYWPLPYLGVMLAMPLFARFVAPLSPVAVMIEKGPTLELTLDLSRATWIELIPPNEAHRMTPNRISAELFRQNIFGSFHGFYPRQTAFLEAIGHPGVVLVCPGSTETAFLVIDASHLKEASKSIVALGRSHRAEGAEGEYSPSFLENSVALSTAAK
jgi:hypothetical protein